MAFGELYQYTLSGSMSPIDLKDLHEWVIKPQLRTLPGESEILAETARRFFLPGGFDVHYTFEGPLDAPASTLVVRVNGTEARATRQAP